MHLLQLLFKHRRDTKDCGKNGEGGQATNIAHRLLVGLSQVTQISNRSPDFQKNCFVLEVMIHTQVSCALTYFPSFDLDPSPQAESTSHYLVDIGIQTYFEDTSLCFL